MTQITFTPPKPSSVWDARATTGGLRLRDNGLLVGIETTLAARGFAYDRPNPPLCRCADIKPHEQTLTRLIRSGSRIELGKSHDDPNGISVVQSLATSLQDSFPTAAAEIVTLSLTYERSHYEYLPPSLKQLRLGSLRTLTLSGVMFEKKPFQRLLRTHKDTLQHVELVDVAIPLRDDGPLVNQVVDDWIEILKFIGTDTEPGYVMLHRLTWCDGITGTRTDTYLETPHADMRVHHPTLFPGDGVEVASEWWELSNGGVEIVGLKALGYGLEALIDELEKEKISIPRDPLEEGSVSLSTDAVFADWAR